MSITRQQLSDALPILPYNMLDNDYSLTTKDWIAGEFTEALRKNQYASECREWMAENNDCDDFAFFAMSFARMIHHRVNPSLKTSLAFGVVLYKRDVGGFHAANCALVRGIGGELEMVWYEPQSGDLFEPSSKEWDSIEDIII